MNGHASPRSDKYPFFGDARSKEPTRPVINLGWNYEEVSPVKRLITFDSSMASAYDINDIVYPLRSLPGVKSVEVLRATEGSPVFCILFDYEDARDSELVAKFEGIRQGYEGYYSNFSTRAYRNAL